MYFKCEVYKIIFEKSILIIYTFAVYPISITINRHPLEGVNSKQQKDEIEFKTLDSLKPNLHNWSERIQDVTKKEIRVVINSIANNIQ